MDMDGLNGVTIFVSVAFTISGVIGLTDATDSFGHAEESSSSQLVSRCFS